MRHLFLLFLIASSLAATEFNVPDQPYRCPPEETSCKSLHNLSSFEQPAGTNYSINYVEYRDNGKPWNEHQLPDALEQLTKARARNQYVLVLLYVHGWQNNADEILSDDPVKFRNAVADIAKTYFPGSTPTGAAPPVVGIYLAWRGLTFTVEPFKHIISYWPRRQTARSIGKEGMFQALKQITSRIGEDREHYMFICVGHSFGARVLESAADAVKPGHPERAGFMSEYRQRLKGQAQELSNRATSNELPPADLIFYVNAATSSAVTRRTIADLKEVCKRAPATPICRARPMYFAVTSTADLATGVVMPIANLVIPALKTDGLRLVSAANSPTLHTHHLPEKAPCPPPPETVKCNEENSFCFEAGKGQDRSCYKVLPIESKASAPFWIMNVGPSIIKDHGDVWNDAVVAMVKAVSDQNEHFNRMRGNAANAARQMSVESPE
jgi:hypothetical protein